MASCTRVDPAYPPIAELQLVSGLNNSVPNSGEQFTRILLKSFYEGVRSLVRNWLEQRTPRFHDSAPDVVSRLTSNEGYQSVSNNLMTLPSRVQPIFQNWEVPASGVDKLIAVGLSCSFD